MGNIKDVFFAMTLQHEKATEIFQGEYDSKRDDLRTKIMEEREILKNELELTISDLWELFQQALNNYKHSTADKQVEFEKLRANDIKSAAIIERQTRKLNRLVEKQHVIKTRLTSQQQECEERNVRLKRKKENVLINFQKLKQKMAKSQNKNHERLLKLTVDSKECMTVLNEQKKLAEHLLKLVETARALETEEEKVLPLYAETVTPEEVAELAATVAGAVEPHSGEGDSAAAAVETTETAVDAMTPQVLITGTNAPVDEFRILDNFWKRYNKALLDKVTVQREQEALNDENQRLRSVLKQYMDGISVSESVLQQDNTLLIVNGRTNAPVRQNVPVGDARVKAVAARSVIPVQNLALSSVGQSAAQR